MSQKPILLPELFRHVFWNRVGLLRLAIVVAGAVILGVVLGVTGAAPIVRNICIAGGGVLAGTLMVAPVYRRLRSGD
jgi:hypothetical protein